MIPRHVVIIFPKEEAYKNRSEEFKSEFRSVVKNCLRSYLEVAELDFSYFAEDELACTILPDIISSDRVNLLTCFNSMDRVIARKWLSGRYDYQGQAAKDCDVTVIKEVYKHCKLTESEKDVGVSAAEKNGYRLLMKKRRNVISEFLKKPYYMILYLDGSNQYCNLSDPVLGDLRMIHKINTKTLVSEYWYSGQDLTKEIFFTVIKEATKNG